MMETTLLADKYQDLLGEDVKNSEELNVKDREIFGQKIGFLTTLFGCWHTNVSRPFIRGNTAFRTCLECGARKRFDPQTLKTHGSFYYPPQPKQVEHTV